MTIYLSCKVSRNAKLIASSLEHLSVVVLEVRANSSQDIHTYALFNKSEVVWWE
jgi:hypothetical protein